MDEKKVIGHIQICLVPERLSPPIEVTGIEADADGVKFTHPNGYTWVCRDVAARMDLTIRRADDVD